MIWLLHSMPSLGTIKYFSQPLFNQSMKLNFNFFTLFFLLFIGISSFAQSNWQKGYYVSSGSDTVRGFIDHKEWVRNPSSFSFKKTLDQKDEKTLHLKEVRYFEVTDWVAYKKYFVSISMNDSQLGTSGSQHPSRNDTVFLQLVQTGDIATLYRYKDDLKERYYLQGPSDPSPSELLYSIETTSDGVSRVVEKYKGQLFTFAAKAGKLNSDLEWRIKKTSYGAESLSGIVSRINGTENIKVKTNSGQSNKGQNGLSFYFGIGLSKSDLVYSGGAEWAKSSSSSNNPYGAIGLTYFTSPSVRRTFLNAELSLTSASFHTVANNLKSYIPQRVDYTFTQVTTGLMLSLNYNFYHTSKTSCFLGAGIRASFHSYSNNVYTITETYPGSITTSSTPDYFSLATKYISPSIRTGVVFGDKLDVILEYNTGIQINQAAPLWDEKIVTTRFGINYRMHSKVKN